MDWYFIGVTYQQELDMVEFHCPFQDKSDRFWQFSNRTEHVCTCDIGMYDVIGMHIVHTTY